MKKTTANRKKPDILFIITVSAFVVLLFVVSLLAKAERQVVPSGDLPDDGTNNIHELVISEIMSNNSGVYVNDRNESTDYIELYNGTSRTIKLDGYGLSDRTDAIKWAFSNQSIEPGQYLVVALTGKLEPGLNAPFKLSSKGGENVILINSSSKVIDAVETTAMEKNHAMMRDADGKWFVSEYGTPGFSNSLEGLEQYHQSLMGDEEPEIVVNELLVRNEGNFRSEQGTFDGFIEFKNVSDHAVDMADYNISDDIKVPFRYHLETKQLMPGEVFYYYTGKVTDSRYIGFNFISKTGNIILSKNGRIVQDIPYTNLANGMAMVRNDDGTYYSSNIVSPGYQNDPDGIAEFQEKFMSSYNGLVINEVMNKNDSYLPQNGNQYYDWIEFRNNSSETINLADYYIGKNDGAQNLYQLPEVELASGEYYLIMCSGNENLSNNSYRHMGFKLGQADSLYLYKGSEIVDSMNFADIPYGYSYGRGSSNGFFYMSSPSPGWGNESGYRSVTTTPAFSLAAGVYNDVDSLTVSISAPGTIHYTLDGSMPTTWDPVYEGPLTISSTTVVKAKAYVDGAITSKLGCATYVVNEHHTVPVMSVSLDASDFRYLNYNAGVIGLEEQAYAELFEEDNSFSIPCSMACFGGNTRSHPKKSYALRFNDQWGQNHLEYPLFDRRDNSIYESLVLRTGSNDWDLAYIRDILVSELVDQKTNIDVQAYKICVLYINGEYWGLYNIREKINPAFISENFNIDKEGINIVRIDYDVTSGSYWGYQQVRNFCNSHNLAYDENFDALCEMIDIDNFIDYWIAVSYTTNNDIVNCRFWNSENYNGGRWRWILYDSDYAWYNSRMNYYTNYLVNPAGIGDGATFENDILIAVFRNDRFCEMWLDRLSVLVKEIFNEENVVNTINMLHDQLLPEMQRNQSEWGLTVSEWESNIQDLRGYASRRTNYLLSSTKSFFGLSDARMKELFGDLW